ncbi:alpha/beta fold hydrolase [Methylobacillus flagellatus]|nr:alpha/beta fold hydrolase [Methylobacillus flagellatus]
MRLPSFLSFRLLLALFVTVLVLPGCAGVKVSSVEVKDYLNQRRGDVLTTGRLSHATDENLRVVGLDASSCLAREMECKQAIAGSQGLRDERRLATLSELWLKTALDGEKADQALSNGHATLDAYLQSARYAYAYLFHTSRQPSERAFEDRQTQVRDYYNFAAQQVLTLLFRMHKHGGQDRQPLQSVGNWQLQTRLENIRLPEGQPVPEEIIPASSLTFTGLRNMYRRDGLGAELVAVTRPPVVGKEDSAPFSETAYPAISVVLLFKGESINEILDTQQVEIVGYDPYRQASIQVGNTQVPLAANFTSGYGLWLARSGFAAQAINTLFGRATGLDDPHIYLMQPFDPNRRIILMLHGLASSPEAWINVANEVLGDEALRQHYQIWQVYYPTNAPLAYNNFHIRAALQTALETLDPAGTSLASNHIVAVGHSMGGVLSRLMISSSGEGLWDSFLANYPLQGQRLERAQERLGPYLRFGPVPQIKRAIFVAAPHRGTPFAENNLSRWLSNLISLPVNMARRFSDVLIVNPSNDSGTADGGKSVRIPNSINNLSDRDTFVRLASSMPISPAVPYHSIIGNYTPKLALEDSDDGVVPYASAHLAGAQSELVIPSWHSVQETPQAILEIRRILRLDIESASQSLFNVFSSGTHGSKTCPVKAQSAGNADALPRTATQSGRVLESCPSGCPGSAAAAALQILAGQ